MHLLGQWFLFLCSTLLLSLWSKYLLVCKPKAKGIAIKAVISRREPSISIPPTVHPSTPLRTPTTNQTPNTIQDRPHPNTKWTHPVNAMNSLSRMYQKGQPTALYNHNHNISNYVHSTPAHSLKLALTSIISSPLKLHHGVTIQKCQAFWKNYSLKLFTFAT